MINVYAWPPVGVIGHEWTEEAPIQRSRSILTGKDYISAHSRKRKRVTLVVSSLALGQTGAGYMEVLKYYLDGGANAVRLFSLPINWWQDGFNIDPAWVVSALGWQIPPQELNWANLAFNLYSIPLSWQELPLLSGTLGTTTGLSGQEFPIVTVTGLQPNLLIVRPGDIVRGYSSDGTSTSSARVAKPCFSDASGVAVIFLLEPLLHADKISLRDSETAVFRPESIPRAVQPLDSDWTYSWDFREVFADEVGGFNEVDPWS